MDDRLTVVLDIGKTVAKASLWDAAGTMIDRRSRANEIVAAKHYRALDTAGIEAWFAETLSGFARIGRVGAIVPVAHGAAAAILGRDGLAVPIMDYESEIPSDVRATYLGERGPDRETGSPAMDLGLNLGLQLYYQQAMMPGLFEEESTILPWAQYWAYVLSGIAVSEVSSFGAHTDLWNPARKCPSQLATRRGWAARFAPFRKAGEIVGPISSRWADRCRLPTDVDIYTGIHDSNAALHAARANPEIAAKGATILSTGTWFVSMRSLALGQAFDIGDLPYDRGCLANVDPEGKPVPTALFMGGRELDLLNDGNSHRIDDAGEQPALLQAVAKCLKSGAMILPTQTEGIGPFAGRKGAWIDRPADPLQITAVMALYVALVADAALDLIGSENILVIDGRFGNASVFTGALAALRSGTRVFTSSAEQDVSWGALRLARPELGNAGQLSPVEPLDSAVLDYRDRWRSAL
jgi:sugar (pentulose or hexulose) kinase